MGQGLPIGSLFEEVEEDGEQVMQRADAKKFEEEQKNDESLRAWWKLAEASGVTEREENYGDETSA